MNKKRIPPRRQRMYFIIFSALLMVVAAYMILTAFRDNIVFFRTPTDVVEGRVKEGVKIRIGGLVREGSLNNTGDNYSFLITDNNSDVAVYYTGMLPSLFREGQGVVAYGSVDKNGQFQAEEILAKHDEKYMPKEVYDAIKKDGRWKGAE